MIPTLLTEYAARISAAWKIEVSKIIEELHYRHPAVAPVANTLENFLSNPGKLLRPSLFLHGYELASNNKPNQDIIRLSLSFELIHAYFLIQDDVFDCSNLRRNQPAMHVCFANRFSSTYLGNSLATLVGDFLGHRASRLWTEAEIAGVATPQLRTIFEQMEEDTYWGEYLDLVTSASPLTGSLADIIEIMESKSGEYSIWRPLQIGLLLGGATLETSAWSKDFGRHLGLAFQTVDDIIGSFGKPDQTGKPVDSDIIERKLTLLFFFAHQDASPENQKTLEAFYAENIGTPGAIKQIFQSTQADKSARQFARTHYEQALVALQKSGLSSEKTALLAELAYFLTERKA